MRIRPQTELTQVQKTLALNQAEAVDRRRFDTALLQAAQGVRDSEGDAFSGLGAKAQQALADALDELSDKSLSQLKDLAENPRAMADLVASLGQGSALNPAETARLGKLLTMALPRLLEAKGKGGSAGTESLAGASSRTKGANQGQNFFSQLTGQEAALGAGAASAQGNAFASVAGALDGANQGLAGIQGGQAYGAFPAFGSGQQTASVSVAVNGNTVSLAGASGTEQVAGANAQGTGAEQAQGTNGQGARGAQQVQNAEGADADLPAFLDLDVQIVDVNAPLAVQPNSQVTLKGDNTWVYPQGAQTQAIRPQPQAQASRAGQEQQAPSAAGVAGRGDGSAESGLPSFGQTLSEAGAQADGFEIGLDGGGQDSGAAGVSSGKGGSSLAQVLEQDTQLEDGADSGILGSGTQASAANQTTPGQGNLGSSQAQNSLQVFGQAPLILGPGQAGSSNGQQGRSGTRGLSSDNGSTTQGGSTGVAATNAGFDAALAALNQSAGQGSGAGAGQGAEKPLTAGIAQAVAQALNQAGPSTPGRLLIQLSPSALGTVQVDLSMVDGKLTARLVAGQQDLRDALARDLSGFKASLESHGVVVNEVSVALGSGMDTGQNNNSSRQDPQTAWRTLAQTASRPSDNIAVAAGWGAYGLSASDASQGFSALA